MAVQSVDCEITDWMSELIQGRRKLPKSDSHRHHYNPQFMLKQFRDRDGKIFVLDKTCGTCESVAVKDAAFASDLYAVESVSGQDDGIAEAFFAVIEGYAAPSLARLLRQPGQFTERDRGNLAFLFAVQEQRVPGFLDEFEGIITQITTMDAIAAVNRAARMSAGQRRNIRQTTEELLDGRLYFKAANSEVIRQMLLGVASTVNVVFNLSWNVVRAHERSFVTSDRPLTMRDPTPPHRFSGPAWLSSPSAITTMPLSSRAVVQMSPAYPDRFSDRSTTRVARIERINLQTYGSATRFLYGPDQRALLDLHALASENPNLVPKPRKKTMVVVEDADKADPAQADRNAAQGLDRYLDVSDGNGGFRRMSYEVINTIDDAREAMRPRPLGADIELSDASSGSGSAGKRKRRR